MTVNEPEEGAKTLDSRLRGNVDRMRIPFFSGGNKLWTSPHNERVHQSAGRRQAVVMIQQKPL